MFTGIVECIGQIERVEKEGSNVHLWVVSSISDELKIDQSVAHDGVCLTVTSVEPGCHAVTLVAESLERSHFKNIKAGNAVNLERAVTLQHRLDGHIVQGHVDGVITCLKREDRDGSWWFTFQFSEEHAHLFIDKGSVCINGVSLTVIHPTRDTFSVTIIPYTIEHTTFGQLQPGDLCNVEFDLVAKYLARWRELG